MASKKVDLRSIYPSLRKNRIPGDFRFIIIHRVYYPESSGSRQQNLLMTFYALISKIGIDEPKALGLDTSMVVVERVPLQSQQPAHGRMAVHHPKTGALSTKVVFCTENFF